MSLPPDAAVHPALLVPDWPAPAAVRALVTQRHAAGASLAPFASFNLGNCSGPLGDDPAVVDGNRAELVRIAGLPAPPHWLHQVHGTQVVRFPTSPAQHSDVGACRGADCASAAAQADAAVTGSPGCVLAVLTADCLPVLLCAEDADEVAAAHAGWRGLAAGVLERTVAAMATPATRLLAWLGPAAGPLAYEIGDEVRDALLADDAKGSAAFVATRPGHWRVDLYALARRRLRHAGVARIFGGEYCTISQPQRFFSHRRDGRSGRMASLIWIDPRH